MTMIRVLHLGKFYPPDTGGIESVTATLARAAASAHMDTEVLCFAEHARDSVDDQGVKVTRAPQLVKVASQPMGLRYAMHAIAKGRRADIVHVHVPNMLAALLTLALGRRAKVVVHWHSDVIGKGWLGRLLHPIEHAMLRRADRIICTSRRYADASEALGPYMAKTVVIPIGVRAPDRSAMDMTPVERASTFQSLPEALKLHVRGRPLILCVGRLVPYKGYVTLIEAVHRMKMDAAIVIVGGGPLLAELEARIRDLRGMDRVMLAGRVEDETLSSLLRLSTIYCMPSIERSEAFGVALVEAMACGLPLLATDIPGSGVPWVNQHDVSGLNVAPGEPVALAEALDKLLLDDSLRTRLAHGARTRYQAHFTEGRSTEATLDLYRHLLRSELV